MQLSNIIPALLDRLLPKRVIVNCEREPYLHRWFLLRWGERIGIYIHRFERSDEDRALHDHPWSFIVVPLWRGYLEHNERMQPCALCGGLGGWYLPHLGLLSAQQYEQPPGWTVCHQCEGEGAFLQPHVTRVYPIIGARLRRPEYRHRVELLTRDRGDHYACLTGEPRRVPMPAWSLFIRFQRCRVWGFTQSTFGLRHLPHSRRHGRMGAKEAGARPRE